ncbi:serine/threonine-protein kinase/endoribonuclease IRE1a-like [Prunus avium]|uniref:non-specific serine/threonine protein kinase n=1 Tax=Prunus avium TaxID=42229 RepID=A0A6P5RPR9_PRUAV|nr:serine/threonine-protein kinase/endoribonuclease IRE1a-like [Prunus avium]
MKHQNSIWAVLLLILLIAGFFSSNGDVSSLESRELQILGDYNVLNSECKALQLLVLHQKPNGDVLNWESRELQPLGSHQNQLEVFSRSPSRRLHSHTPDPTALVATLDGRIHLVESNSMRVLWSLASGPPLYTSYQAQDSTSGSKNSRYFIDCGDDWNLYLHRGHFGREKLPYTIDEYVGSTPHSEDDGSITVGSKKNTVFEVDLLTGELIRPYALPNSPSTLKSNEKQRVLSNNNIRDNKELVKPGSINRNAAQQRLLISRIDYSLQSFVPYSDQVSWNMTVGEIWAALLCPDNENPLGGAPLNSKNVLGSETSSDIAPPLSCQSKKLIFPQRNHTLLELVGPGRKLQDQETDTMVQKPASGLMVPSKPEVDNKFFNVSTALTLIFLFVILMGFVVYHCASVVKGQVWLHDQRNNSDSRTAPSKRKKSRKSEKNSGVISSQDEEALTHTESDNKTRSFLNKLFDGGTNGRRIGKLLISNKEISKGSNGTIVLEGVYEGRPVAVKRLVLTHHDVAFKEIQNLIASDRHPNIVRWYGVEYDQDFVYIALERCICNLDDLIQICSDSSKNPVVGEEDAKRVLIGNEVHLESVKNIMSDVNLWKTDGFPSPLLLRLLRDVVSGLVHLHELGIIHRDLKPQNVLLIKERSLCAKLSDMGISKRLIGDMSSLGHHATGSGSSGWQAPEQLLHGRQTRAVDLFSLGCVIFFCITGGRHPFGDHLERDINIVKNKVDLFLVEYIPEAVDLISRLLNRDPEWRPKALEVLLHPLFWSSEMRLSFLRDTSDRVELEDREANSGLLKALESIAPMALGGKWDEKMEPAFLTNIGHYRRYKFDSVRDLLRVIRNKSNHYRELPTQIQKLVGPVPEGFDSYFASRFPRLLIEVYIVVCTHCRGEECFEKYFKTNAEGL